MKKTLLLILGVIVLGSCAKEKDKNSVTISKDEYENLKTQEREYPKPFSLTENPNNGDAILLGSDGHEYIATRSVVNALVHSPECLKCKDKEVILNNLLIEILNKKNRDTVK